jgi:hypothetical protein
VIFYLPVKLLPWQEELINKRLSLVNDAVMVEWNEWTEERKKGLVEVEALRQRAEELAKDPGDEEMDVSGEQSQPMSGPASAPAPAPAPAAASQAEEQTQKPTEESESRD